MTDTTLTGDRRDTVQAVHAVVRLRVADPVAASAHYAMTHHLRGAGGLAALSRAWLWRFELAADAGADVEALVRGWLVSSERFANPNQHELAVGAAGLTPATGGTRVWVAVRDHVDLAGDEATALIRERLHGEALVVARRAVTWELGFAAAVTPADALERAGELAHRRRRDVGLLANPSFQTAVVSADGAPEVLAAALWGRP